MPSAAMMYNLQGTLTPEAIDAVRAERPDVLEQLNQPGTLVDVAGSVVDFVDDDRAYLEAIPPALREGIRAAIASAIAENKAVHVSYSPGYDFEVRVNDYVEGISVHLSGPYPPAYPRNQYRKP